MKTDHELLELAAKAAFPDCAKLSYPLDWVRDCVGEWNPLTDDGDALRLAVSRGMSIITGVWNCHVNVGSIHVEQPYDGDAATGAITAEAAMPATRRAIVRAAAAIGESMQ